MELPAGHRFRAVAATLGLGAWAAKTSRKSFSSSLASSVIGGDGKQLVGEIDEHAVIAGGVIGEGDA